MVSSVTAYEEHQQWLTSMRTLHAARSVDSGSHSSLPNAPMTWALPEEDVSSGQSSGLVFEDEDFEAPVYRSLGGMMSMHGAGSTELEVGDDDFEEPVYRSLGGFLSDTTNISEDLQLELPSRQQPSVPTEAERDWLATMPPLVQRQRGHGASINLAPL